MEQTMTADAAAADLDLRDRIEDALWSLDTVRNTRPAIAVTVRGGHAALDGVVPSPMIRDQIEHVVRGVAGLSGLSLNLLSDSEIEYRAAYALATDARTRGIRPGYRVVSRNGQIRMIGRLSPDERAAAEAVLRSVRGVRAVVVG